MIRETIIEINNRFINEAKSSPRLFEDLAQLEHYIAESYGNRVLIELIQNADDAQSNRVYLYFDGINLYLANNGRNFNEEDIMAISRSGNSSKNRKVNIGYRGVGFKSTTFLTNDIVIYSNGEYFTFSMQKTKENLAKYGIKKCPTVRIPFIIEKGLEDRISNVVSDLVKKGFSTIFVFKNANIELIREELFALRNDTFIFLNNLCEFKVSVEDIEQLYKVSKHSSYISISSSKGKSTWKILKGQANELPFQIAFEFDGKNLIPCNNDESVLHVFLPTLDKLGFPFKINGYFSTDPSRKHIHFDDDCKGILDATVEMVIQIIRELFELETEETGILQIVTTNNSFSKFSIYFEDKLFNLLKESMIIKTRKGELKCVSEILKVPHFLTIDEFNNLIDHCDYLNYKVTARRMDGIMSDFFDKFSINCLNLDDLTNIFSKEFLNNSISQVVLGKLFGYFTNEIAHQDCGKLNFSNAVLLDKKGSVSRLEYFVNGEKELHKEFIKGFSENVNDGALEYIERKYKVSLASLLKNNITIKDIKEVGNMNRAYTIKNNPDKTYNIGLNISKWRSAEIQCVEIEKYLFGNKATDVSKQNKGYDIESIDNNNNIKYIEVKSLKNDGEYFTLTNNEYTTAHMYAEKYFLFLCINQNSKLKVIYIKDPINNLKLEKRIKQWEWFCDEYNGEEYTINLEE